MVVPSEKTVRKGRWLFSRRRVGGFWLGIVLFLLMLLLPRPAGMSPSAQKMAAIALLMACWWISEAIPIAATALVPLVAYPLLKIIPTGEVARSYATHNIFLFMGGFFISMAMRKWNLHRRIALHIISWVGFKPSRIVLGFMLSTAFLSMWISDTATAMMMFPIALSVITHAAEVGEKGSVKGRIGDFGFTLMLGIAYSSVIGGVGTLIGTPPNIIFAGTLKTIFPKVAEFDFFHWMMVGVPFVILFIPLAWLYLVRVATSTSKQDFLGSGSIIKEELKKLGPMSRGERYTMIIFASTAFLWIFRQNIKIGEVTIPGWSDLLGIGQYVQDSTVAIAMALVMFFLPVDLRKGDFLLDWEWAKRIPWGILILFGGGFALASGFSQTGLAGWIGGNLKGLGAVPVFGMVLLVSLLMTFLTEVTSNTATATTFMPILAATALAVRVHPFMLMIPATMSASCAFMLPVATPPNAIVFGSGYLTIPRMARVGVVMNFIGAALIFIIMYFLAVPLLGIEPWGLPSWAQ
ncbi:MAG: DASS family sodium-coupled anion symporter [Acidobacteriota bacterium]